LPRRDWGSGTMTIRPAHRPWSDHWYRVVVLGLVFGLMAAQGPAPAFARASGELNDNSGCCESCDLGATDPATEADVSYTDSRSTHAEDEPPGDQPCRPNGCTHCSLPCCGEVLSVREPLVLTAGSPPAGFLAASQGSIPLSVDPLDITHPPRP
jgi:hypothetical protein